MASFAQWLPELPCASLWKAGLREAHDYNGLLLCSVCVRMEMSLFKLQHSSTTQQHTQRTTQNLFKTTRACQHHASSTPAPHSPGHPAQRASREHGEAACFAHAACRKQRKTCGLAAIDCRKCCGARCLASVQAPRRPCARVQVHSGTRCSCNAGSPNTAFRDVFCDEVLVVTLRSEC